MALRVPAPASEGCYRMSDELNARSFDECLRQQAENGRQIEVNREHERVSDENIEREKSVLRFPGIRR
jgi:hypothetical protein